MSDGFRPPFPTALLPVAEIVATLLPVAEIVLPVAEDAASLLPVAEIVAALLPVPVAEDAATLLPVAEVVFTLLPVAEVVATLLPVAEPLLAFFSSSASSASTSFKPAIKSSAVLLFNVILDTARWGVFVVLPDKFACFTSGFAFSDWLDP